MTEQDIYNIIKKLKENNGELTYIECKENLPDKNKIGETLSGLSNSASYENEKYGYMIWGLKDKDFEIVGTVFDLVSASESKGHKIYPSIIKAFGGNIPEIDLWDFLLNNKRIHVVRIKNCENKPVAFNGIAFIRLGTNDPYSDKLLEHPTMLEKIINKHLNESDWSTDTTASSNINMIDDEAYKYLFDFYYNLDKNKHKDKTYNKTQFLNMMGLLDKDKKPNNSCLVFLGKYDLLPDSLKIIRKIDYKYKDDNGKTLYSLKEEKITEPFILLRRSILSTINERNFNLPEIDLFDTNIQQYDINAIDELLINSIVHRDWRINLWIEIIHTPKSLKIKNPGVFKAELREVIRYNHRPPYINNNMSEFMKKLDLMEKEASGIKKSFTLQNKKGLNVSIRSTNGSVDVILDGKIINSNFVRFIRNKKNELISESNIILLYSIANSKIKISDIDKEEYESIKDFVSKRKSGFLSIKKDFLSGEQKFKENYLTSHSGSNVINAGIIDYAKNTKRFTTQDIYSIFSGKPQSTIRGVIKTMLDLNILISVKKGTYSLNKSKKGLK